MKPLALTVFLGTLLAGSLFFLTESPLNHPVNEAPERDTIVATKRPAPDEAGDAGRVKLEAILQSMPLDENEWRRSQPLESPGQQAIPQENEGLSVWDRIGAELKRRLGTLPGEGRKASIAFAHFLERHSLDLETTTDEALTSLFDSFEAIEREVDRELVELQGDLSRPRDDAYEEEIEAIMSRGDERHLALALRFGGV